MPKKTGRPLKQPDQTWDPKNSSQIKPKFDLNSEILLAKMGNKEAFNKLWELYQPIIIRNLDRFCSLSKGLEQYRPAMGYDSYVYFWDIINSYDFNSSILFSYYVNDQLLERTKKKIKGNKILVSELIDDEKLRSYPGYKSLVNRGRLNDLRAAMKKLSPKQLKAVYLYHYIGFNQEKSAEIVGISQIGLRKRLKQSYAKMKKFFRILFWSRLSRKERTRLKKLKVKKPRSKSRIYYLETAEAAKRLWNIDRETIRVDNNN